jgi:cellobiose phosphorylase
VAKNKDIEQYEIEPYVYAQNILGDEHPQFGLGRNSWLSGTASWCYQAATQWILGIQSQYDGLLIDPCIPSDWEGFEVSRKFRGKNLLITVHNLQHVSKGVVKVTVDGFEIPGNNIPAALFGNHEHKIEVWMGKS